MMTQLTRLMIISLGLLLLASHEGMATSVVSGLHNCLASRGDQCIVECQEETNEECSLVRCQYPEGFRNGGHNRLDFGTNATSAGIFADLCEDIYDEFTDLSDLLATNIEWRGNSQNQARENAETALRLAGELTERANELTEERRARRRLENSVGEVCRLTIAGAKCRGPNRNLSDEATLLCSIREAVAEHCSMTTKRVEAPAYRVEIPAYSVQVNKEISVESKQSK